MHQNHLSPGSYKRHHQVSTINIVFTVAVPWEGLGGRAIAIKLCLFTALEIDVMIWRLPLLSKEIDRKIELALRGSDLCKRNIGI